MAIIRQNCWEFMQCGREPGGNLSAVRGPCPAAVDATFEGINSGKCAGRFCWAVAGTLCGGMVQGTFAEKRDSCTTCDFYRQVQAEEGTANLRKKFLRFMPPLVDQALLKGLAYKRIVRGERFITQGEIGTKAYIIQRGACVELVEKDHMLHPVAHRAAGDIVGLLSVMTGEPRHVHVEAETEMEVWVLDQSDFDAICNSNPDLSEFLTELVARRFDCHRPIAERTIGKYIATHIIGRGGYGIVYKGLHAELEMPVAIKMLRHDLSLRSEFLSTFRNEAKIIAHLNHENIIKVFDIEERFKTHFIIMEYLGGQSLKQMLACHNAIAPLRAAHFLIQLCAALAYAESKGLVHRDINPSNVIVLPNDRVKLIDFGLACPTNTDDLLMPGVISYMAPELLDGKPADHRSDLYSLGISTYEILTGRLPFYDENAGRLMKMIRSRDIPDPADLVPNLPQPLRRFILKACRRDPSQRYATASQAMKEIQGLFQRDAPPFDSLDAQLPRKMAVYLPNPASRSPELNQLLEEFRAKIHTLGGRLAVEETDAPRNHG